ncbi:hypothetical protein RB195_023505 [Necator americanus]|uniref:Uncharacterized protein n=1 Tax=Necator americanus TaxID=51031 RepID=A0ABR1EKC4_NECAM
MVNGQSIELQDLLCRMPKNDVCYEGNIQKDQFVIQLFNEEPLVALSPRSNRECIYQLFALFNVRIRHDVGSLSTLLKKFYFMQRKMLRRIEDTFCLVCYNEEVYAGADTWV